MSSCDDTLTMPKEYKSKLLPDPSVCDFEMSYGGRTEITYVNTTNVTLYVADRNGGVMAVKPTNSGSFFAIRISKSFGKTTETSHTGDVCAGLMGKARPSDAEKAMRRSYSVYGSRNERFLNRADDVHYQISMKDLKDYDGVIYHKESDLTISLTYEKARHYHSDMEVFRRATQGMRYVVEGDTHGVTMAGFRIVSNRGRIRDHFIMLAGVVHRIKPIKDPACEDGIYVVREGALNHETDSREDGFTFYEFSEEICKELGLFKSYEEALHWADDLRQASERELTDKKSELALRKTEVETEQLQRKDHYDERAAYRKDYYDDTGSRRKDTSDELKWILGMTATLLGLVALFRR